MGSSSSSSSSWSALRFAAKAGSDMAVELTLAVEWSGVDDSPCGQEAAKDSGSGRVVAGSRRTQEEK